MPALADIVVKKNDGTTDITYTAISPAAGDGANAIWRSQSVGNAVEHQPELRLLSKDSGQSRKLVGNMHYPQIATNTTTNTTSVLRTSKFRVEVDLAKGMPLVDTNEFVAQATGLFRSALIQACLKGGVSAT